MINLLTDGVINDEPVGGCPVVVGSIVMLWYNPAIITINFIFSTNYSVKVDDEEREKENIAERERHC